MSNTEHTTDIGKGKAEEAHSVGTDIRYIWSPSHEALFSFCNTTGLRGGCSRRQKDLEPVEGFSRGPRVLAK
jgi:hypothetical protein